MIGKRYIIAGMLVEIITDESDKWQVRSLTTNETVLMEKSMLEKSIRLGKAEEIPVQSEKA